MATLRDTKKRITSVKNMQKITRAMKLVSAAKLRRAAERVEAARPYAEKVQKTASGLAALRLLWQRSRCNLAPPSISL